MIFEYSCDGTKIHFVLKLLLFYYIIMIYNKYLIKGYYMKEKYLAFWLRIYETCRTLCKLDFLFSGNIRELYLVHCSSIIKLYITHLLRLLYIITSFGFSCCCWISILFCVVPGKQKRVSLGYHFKCNWYLIYLWIPISIRWKWYPKSYF